MFQLVRRFFRSPGQLDEERNKGVARIARQENDRQSVAFALRNEIFPAQLVPPIRLCPLLEKIVSVDDAGNTFVLLGLERERLSDFFAKVGAEEVRTQVRPLFGMETSSASPPESWRARLLRFHLTSRFMANRSLSLFAPATRAEAVRARRPAQPSLPRTRGKERTKERIDRDAVCATKRDRIRHPKSPRNGRHQVRDRGVVAANVGKDPHRLCARAAARLEIPRRFAMTQNRLESAPFPERDLAARPAVGIKRHDTEALVQSWKPG